MIAKGYKKNFETIRKAVLCGDLCMAECRDSITGAAQIVLCAVEKDAKGMFVFSPLARMFDGNPYDEFEMVEPGAGERLPRGKVEELCPSCDRTNISREAGNYICNDCGAAFDTPARSFAVEVSVGCRGAAFDDFMAEFRRILESTVGKVCTQLVKEPATICDARDPDEKLLDSNGNTVGWVRVVP